MRCVAGLALGLGLIAACVVGLARAQGVIPAGPAKAERPHSLEGCLMIYHFDYKEDIAPPLKSTEYGWLPGFRAAYRYRNQRRPSLYAKLALDLTTANTTYDGTLQDSTPLIDVTRNVLLNVSGNLGVTFLTLADPPRTLTAYTGLGYRFWERSLGGGAPYREHYAWKYVPLGLRGDYRVNAEWSGAVDVSARLMFGGTIRVYLSDIYSGFNDPQMTLGNRMGWRAEAPLYYRFWSFAPWYEYSAIRRSNAAEVTDHGQPLNPRLGIYEPSSSTHQLGMNLGARLLF